MIAAELVRRGARQHARRTAVLVGDQALTFAEVDGRANQLARALLADGLRPGDAVGLLLDNGPHSLPVDFALLVAGLVRMPLNSRLSPAEHTHMLAETGCRALLYSRPHADLAARLAEAVPGLELVPLEDDGSTREPLLARAARQADTDPAVALGPGDVMLTLYTSGTTGTLKAAEHTQASYAAICANILANVVSPRPDDVMLHAASLIHASGTFVLPFWVRGGASAVLPGFTPASWFEGVERYHATAANLVPTMLQMLLADPAAAAADTSTLRHVIYGASPMPRPVITRALAAWGPIFSQYYGQTEAPLAITVLDAAAHVGPDADRLMGSCGQPSVDAEVRLVDADGQDVADGTPGELWVRAPFTFRGYRNAPDLTAATLKGDGWVATRDVAVRSDDGYLTLVDRTSDMIITGGYNVYPREVEDVLLDHPEVSEAAVVAAPHESWVEAVTAFVVVGPGATVGAEDLRAYTRTRLAGYKGPKQVHVVEAIPKSAVGKILRRALRDPLWAGQDRQDRA